jgi:putative transposase
MARLRRYFVPDQPQHVIQRENKRGPTFAAVADYPFYLDVLREASERHGLQTHADVLMTNHVHLLATPEDPSSLPKTLQTLGRRYV